MIIFGKNNMTLERWGANIEKWVEINPEEIKKIITLIGKPEEYGKQ